MSLTLQLATSKPNQRIRTNGYTIICCGEYFRVLPDSYNMIRTYTTIEEVLLFIRCRHY